jgi:hypothetical protein
VVGQVCLFAPPSKKINLMKLLTAAFLLVLSIAAGWAQAAPAASAGTATGTPLGGYYVVFPTSPNILIHFDLNSPDIGKAFGAAHAVSTAYNHDGGAFKGFVRLRSAESTGDKTVEASEYRKNVRSGKWTEFLNGE